MFSRKQERQIGFHVGSFHLDGFLYLYLPFFKAAFTLCWLWWPQMTAPRFTPLFASRRKGRGLLCLVSGGRNKSWTCPFSLQRNSFPSHYAAHISEQVWFRRLL